MRLLAWLLRGFIFFTLFAFALNNQQSATIRWFFGVEWRAPMVILILAAFAAGCAVGVLAMLPSWWQAHRKSRKAAPPPAAAAPAPAAEPPPPEHPPRDGL